MKKSFYVVKLCLRFSFTYFHIIPCNQKLHMKRTPFHEESFTVLKSCTLFAVSGPVAIDFPLLIKKGHWVIDLVNANFSLVPYRWFDKFMIFEVDTINELNPFYMFLICSYFEDPATTQNNTSRTTLYIGAKEFWKKSQWWENRWLHFLSCASLYVNTPSLQRAS